MIAMQRINHWKKEDHPVSTFRNLVNKEEEVSEVCRLFAATLQVPSKHLILALAFPYQTISNTSWQIMETLRSFLIPNTLI